MAVYVSPSQSRSKYPRYLRTSTAVQQCASQAEHATKQQRAYQAGTGLNAV